MVALLSLQSTGVGRRCARFLLKGRPSIPRRNPLCLNPKQVARARHVQAESYLVYGIVSSGEAECGNTLEDALDQALPGQALVYRPVRQRVYSLLLAGGPGESLGRCGAGGLEDSGPLRTGTPPSRAALCEVCSGVRRGRLRDAGVSATGICGDQPGVGQRSLTKVCCFYKMLYFMPSKDLCFLKVRKRFSPGGVYICLKCKQNFPLGCL